MFLIVMAFLGHAHTLDGLTARIAEDRYATRAACMQSATVRAQALASGGLHGRFLCMRQREPQRELDREAVTAF